jgi:hypothetical protein
MVVVVAVIVELVEDVRLVMVVVDVGAIVVEDVRLVTVVGDGGAVVVPDIAASDSIRMSSLYTVQDCSLPPK